MRRSRSQDKREWERARRLRGGRNPFDSQGEIVKGAILIAGRILDRASHKASFGCQPDRFRYDFGRNAKSFFEIRGDGQVRGAHNQARVRERLISRQSTISSAKRAG